MLSAGPLGMWFAVGLPVYVTLCCGVAAALFGAPKSKAEQAAEDAEQMQALAEWRQAHIARQRAMLRGDKRAIGTTQKVLDQAMASRLRAEMGR